MAKLVSRKENSVKLPFDKSNDIKKLSLFVTIVNTGQGDAIANLFKNLNVSAQFIQKAEGTANRTIQNLLGIEDNRKEVVLSIIRTEDVPSAKKEVESFFLASKRNKGIAISISMTSIVGVTAYRFLANM